MDFKDLTYVVTLAKYQNYTNAAKNLYITQPALTKAIKKLETEMGEPLFIRKENSTVPTEFGLKYIQYAQSILNLKSSMDEELGALHAKKYPILKIGITHVSGRFLLSQTTIAFQRKYPHVQLSISENITSSLYDMVEKGELDFAVCIRPGSPFYAPREDFDYMDVVTNEMVLAVPRSHPLLAMAANKPGFHYPWIPLEWAKEEKFLLQPEDQFTGKAAKYIFREAGFWPKSVSIINNVHSAIDLVCAGCGIALVTNLHLKILEQKVTLIPLSFGREPICSKSAAMFKKGNILPDYALDYIEMVRDAHRPLLMGH